jgi:hypothetical protein
MVRSFVSSLLLQNRLWCPLGSRKIVTGFFFSEREMAYAFILIMLHTRYNLWHLSPVTVWYWWKVSTGANINIKQMQAVCSKRSRLYSWGNHFESWSEYRLLWRLSRLSTVLPDERENITCKATMASFRIHCNMLYILKYWQIKLTLEQATESRCIALLISLTSVLDGVIGQSRSPAALPSGKRPGANFTRGRRYRQNRSVNRKKTENLAD